MLAAEKFAGVHVVSSLDDFPLAVHVKADGGEVFLAPFVRRDHGEEAAAAHFVEVVGLADDWLELDVCLIDELVPIEVVDGFQVNFPDFLEFLLQIPLDLGNPAGFEGSQIVRHDRRAECGNRVGQKRPRWFGIWL